MDTIYQHILDVEYLAKFSKENKKKVLKLFNERNKEELLTFFVSLKISFPTPNEILIATSLKSLQDQVILKELIDKVLLEITLYW